MADITVRAIHTVRRTVTPGKPGDKAKGIAPTPPVTKDFVKGTIFKVGKDELAELLSAKAVARVAEAAQEAEEGDEAKTSRAKPGPKPKKPANPAATTPAPEGQGEGDGTELV